MTEAITYISPAHEAMKPFAERPAKDEKQEHGAMVGIPADVLNTYKPPLSDDTPNFYVENKQEKRVNVTQESLTAALGGLPDDPSSKASSGAALGRRYLVT